MRKPVFLVAIIIVSLAAVLLMPHRQSLSAHGVAHIGGGFTLTDTHGTAVRDSDFRGRVMIVYLGYSHCPDICPLTLATLTDALKLLGQDAAKVAVIFISLDPERDTPPVLAQFLAPFDPRIIGLTGNKGQIEHVVRAYKGSYRKTPGAAPGAYAIDHSGYLYLMDQRGRYVLHFQPDVKAETVAKAAEQVIAGTPPQ